MCVAGDIEAQLQLTTDWGSGYCANLLLTNQGSAPTTTWKVTLDTQGASLSLWNAESSGNVGVVTLTPLLWNARIEPDETNMSVGFCATRPGGNAIATILSAVP
jgi:cellulase/cellobiase CelA1